MGSAIEHVEQITPQWLTDLLQRQGALPQGRVIQVTPGEAAQTFASLVWRLEVAYSADAAQGAPRRLFLKVSRPALAPGAYSAKGQQREIDYYRAIAPAMDGALSVPCYDAVYDLESGAAHLLLRDVSETHEACADPRPGHCERAIDCLAHLHASWWDHPRLGQDIGRYPTREERGQDWAGTVESTTAFLAALGDRISPSRRATYERVLRALPELYERHATGRNLTLAHGDAHLGNFLFPRDAAVHKTYLVDWQFWHPTIGGTDLAFMMATGWAPETRRRLERALLDRYHRRLLAHGVQGYSRVACWDDYRLSVILVSIFIPVWRWAVFKWAIDPSTVERTMTAFEDLRCAELLGQR